MKNILVAGILLAALLSTGCARGLTTVQKRQYAAMEYDNVLVTEKNPTVGAVLGLLPGFGSFYVREPALGVINLLLWPLSMIWDPVSGYQGARMINYDLTRHQLRKTMNDEIAGLDEQLALKQISAAEYMLQKGQIQRQYAYD